ncbi:ABC transporter substrate-binding protein [Mycetocola saprophilus]|uniref:ABC transporter substrate-binding protein n=1 Tax=Mycetocola saprophilus TaxID=76636 RepID=UPI003BF1EDB5
MKSPIKALTLTVSALAAIGLLASCSNGANPGGGESADGQVELSVVSLIPGTEQAAFDAFNNQVKQFEKANPDIKIKPVEYEWKADTFPALLAGGTLPIVYTIPFTDGQTLIENGQIADITEEVKALPFYDKFNKNVLSAGTDDKGHIFAVPREAYGNGLQYNRDLFKQAGLDPDKPPTTWDEVRAAAKTISEKTGAAGYMQMTQGATGGWQTTVATYAHGGRMEEIKGDKVTATLDTDATKKSLQFLKDLRWEDNSMGSNFLYDWGTINKAFASGQIGMFTGGSDLYTALIRENQMDPAHYGITTLPLEGKDGAVLGGGTLSVVNGKASEAQKKAAVKWIDFYYLQKYLDKDAAITDAKTLAAANQAVGTPALPIFDKATLDESREWIKDYINVPQDQVAPFTSKIFDQPLVIEPTKSTQDIYGILSPVVQAVLTDKNADIDALLKQANADAQAVLDRG